MNGTPIGIKILAILFDTVVSEKGGESDQAALLFAGIWWGHVGYA
jgi:hypothetical protein